ncbi:hypothetical protein B7486_55125 [cyanobacterium TDX16]|nr:hypothetical protein B7486_55125 [cyanobacterium TDX16]
MAAFLHRLGDPDDIFEAPPEPTFSDVRASHTFFIDVEWMAWAGISTGNDDGTYRPGAAVSRQAMAAFLHRFAVQSPSILTSDERDAIVAAFGGEATVVHPLDADGVRNDVVALVLSTPTAVQR